MLLEGRVALVTGASRGIGRAIALGLAAEGAYVVGTGTSTDSAAAFAEALAGAGGQGEAAVLDVTDAAACLELVSRLDGDGHPVDILVNNAGITRDGLLMRMGEDDWNVILQTNLTAVYRLSKAVLRGMTKRRSGRIINITSVVGQTGNPGQTNYAAAKAGVIGFTRSLAREVGSRNVTVNAVSPGFIDTDMTRGLPDEAHTALLGQIPLGRLGMAEDIAAAVIFLASPRAGYITGETINVNGGMYMP